MTDQTCTSAATEATTAKVEPASGQATPNPTTPGTTSPDGRQASLDSRQHRDLTRRLEDGWQAYAD